MDRIVGRCTIYSAHPVFPNEKVQEVFDTRSYACFRFAVSLYELRNEKYWACFELNAKEVPEFYKIFGDSMVYAIFEAGREIRLIKK